MIYMVLIVIVEGATDYHRSVRTAVGTYLAALTVYLIADPRLVLVL